MTGRTDLFSRRHTFASSVAYAAAGITLAVGAQAQTTPAANESVNYLDEITVVARRTRDEASVGTKSNIPLVETPQSISVITRESFEARGVTTINEALRYTAGVATETRGGMAIRYDQLNVRGFSPPVYLDGMRLLGGAYAVPQVDSVRVDRIEVLRGPASVLYGNSSPGGLVNMVSRLPSAQPFNEASVRAGTFDLLEASFDFGGAIDEDGDSLYRLVGLASQSDGFVNRTEAERYLFQPSFTWRVSENTELTLLAAYQRDPKGASYGWVPATGTVLPNPLGTLPRDFYDGDPAYERFDREQLSAGYFLTTRFADGWTFRQNLRHLQTDVDYHQFYGAALGADNRTLARGAGGAIESFDALTVDNQLGLSAATGALSHNVLVGLDYQDNRGDARQGFSTDPAVVSRLDVFNPVYGLPPPNIAFTTNQAIQREQIGAYGQYQIKFDGLSLLASGRYDWYDAETKNRVTSVVTPHEQEAFTGRIGALYLFDSGFAPYASYSESFEPQTGLDFLGRPFVPTTGSQVEAGVKYEPPAADALLTLAVYELTRQNVPTADPINTGFLIQSGEIEIRGVELEARATLWRAFDLAGSYTYSDPENTKNNTVVGGVPIQGLKPVGLPSHNASIWAMYRFRQGPLDGLDLGGGVRYVGESAGNAANTFYSPSYTLADLTIRYEPGALLPALQGVTLGLQVSNLFDRTYISTCNNLNVCWFGAPRTVEVSLKYNW